MSNESLESKILTWLRKQGFPLELKVAKAFQGQGFSVLQSSYYTDFEEQKPRETDVIARLYSHYEPIDSQFINELETYAVVECKSTDKPWISFRGAPIQHWGADLFLTNDYGKRLISSVRTKAGKTDLFTTKKYCYSAAIAFNDEGRAFSAMMSVMKAAESLYKEKSLLNEGELAAYVESVYIPIVHAAIVTSAPIFECSINDTYEIDVKEVAQSTVALQYPRQRQDSGDAFVINIINEQSLPSFVENVHGSHQAATSQLEHLRPTKKDV
jgi:hypothetical protein